MSRDPKPGHEELPEEYRELAAQLDREAAEERNAILAEAQAHEGFHGEQRALEALLEEMQASRSPKHPPKSWGGLLGGFLALAVAAALLIMVLIPGPDSKGSKAPSEAERFALDGAEKLQMLHPIGSLSAYGAFSWSPTGSVDHSATLRIWDETPAGSGQPPLEWKGITDSELPFDPGVELPAKIRWSVVIRSAQGQELLRSEEQFAQRLP